MEENEVLEASEEVVIALSELRDKALKNGRAIDIGKMDKKEWLFLRTIAGIGASEVATCLGKNPAFFTGTPLSVWKEKVSHIIKVVDTPILRMGNYFEDGIVKEYEYLTGRKVTRVKDKMFIHRDYDFLFADLDGIIEPAGGDGKGILECKSTVSYVYESWETKLPTYYYRQAMAELSVIHDAEYVDFAILILDSREVKILRINRDNEFIKQQNKELESFWNDYITTNIPPPLSVSELAKSETIENSFVSADDSVLNKFLKLTETKKQIKKLKEDEEEFEEGIKLYMGENETLTYNNDVIATWKSSERNTVDSKKLKIDLPDIAEKYTKKSVVRTLRLKELEITNY